ncbi:hypothetical protein V5O48_018192, partial [Marasmius crinis-equi]
MKPHQPPTPLQKSRNPMENITMGTPTNSAHRSRFEELSETRTRGRGRKNMDWDFSTFFSPSTPQENAQHHSEMPPPTTPSDTPVTSRYDSLRANRFTRGRPIFTQHAQNPRTSSTPPSIHVGYGFTAPNLLQPSFTLPSPISPFTFHDPSLPDGSLDAPVSEPEFPLNKPTSKTKEYRPRGSKKPEMSDREKMQRTMEFIFDELGYSSLGSFLLQLIPPIPRNNSGDFGKRHKRKLKSFLQGKSKDKPLHLLTTMYNHRYSSPVYNSKFRHEKLSAFSPTPPENLRYANPAISCWATRTIGDQLYKEIGRLTVNDGSAPYHAQIVASTNERGQQKGVRTITREDIMTFRVADRVKFFKSKASLTWYLTECMAGPREKGVTVVRLRRPHPIVQFSAISAFVVARNRFATGHFAAVAGIWHLACKSQIDVKRLACRMGLSIHDRTARNALETLAEDALKELREEVGLGLEAGKVLVRWVLDNTQRFAEVYEGGAARKSCLICGTACTCIFLEDCDPNAFNLDEYLNRVLKNERTHLTTIGLFNDINWTHIRGIQGLHALRTLCHFAPPLSHYLKLVSECFRSPSQFAIHRMRDGRKTKVQPLGTNSEKEMETSGMASCLHDFFSQSGVKPEHASKHILWVSGDGGSVLSMDQAKKYLATMFDPSDISSTDYNTLHSLLPTMELWHTQATSQNAIAANHFGPSTTSDPSALSRSAHAAKFKRPTNFRDASNYYNLSRTMGTIWDAEILDCWRITLGLDSHADIIPHFERLVAENKLPSFDSLLEISNELVTRYASLRAYEQALSQKANSSSPDDLKFPTRAQHTTYSDMDVDEAVGDEIKKEEGHKEKDGFDGDRVLANSVLFKFEYSLWIEVGYAISDGDIGRAFEVMKIWIFMFAGSNNTNYRDLLLELWCLFKYESSKELKDAIWNNWLVNLTGELGKWIPADLMQEHYNRWLEDHVGKSGMSFDDPYLRRSISPNVDFFLVLKK